MAFTTPRTWVAGEVLTAANLNTHVRDNLAEIDPSGAVQGQVLKVNAGLDGYDFGGVDVAIGPTRWGTDVGQKYVAFFGDADMDVAVSAGSVNSLLDAGWTVTSIAVDPNGSGTADFASSTDDDIGGFDFNGTGDVLASPFVFGTYHHMRAVQEITGSLPTTLVLKFFAQFTTVVNDEEAGAIGFWINTGGTARGITIHSDGSNFRLRMEGTTTEDAGAAVDTDPHLFEIHVSEDSTQWYIDGVSQGTIAEDADDAWPMGFGAATSTSNRFRIAWAAVSYA